MHKKLMRSSTDSHVAGVAGGLAEYFNIDPTIVRLLFVVATIMGGPGLLIYIVLWVVMPKHDGSVMYRNDNGSGSYEKTKNDEMV
jgi:phage shock protein PspC (stress-responsive transcriptional regulator)